MKDKYVSRPSEDYALIDKHTGELLVYNQHEKVSVDEFIMIFFYKYTDLFKLSGTQLKILMCCWKLSTLNFYGSNKGNVIHNNISFKEYCKKSGLTASKACIDNTICYLCKLGLLLKKCKGEYILNPEYFFKGTLSDRMKVRYCIEVDPAPGAEGYSVEDTIEVPVRSIKHT